jgi:hypothetical protein
MTTNESHRCRLVGVNRGTPTAQCSGIRLVVAALVGACGCIRLPSNDMAGASAGNVERKTAASLVVWDGDKHGGGAKEWSNCNLKPGCESSVKVAPGAGIGGSNALEWHTKGNSAGWPRLGQHRARTASMTSIPRVITSEGGGERIGR